MPTFTIKTKLWLYNTSKAAWHFLTIPVDISEQIRFFNTDGIRQPLGMVKVRATIGKTSWLTSIFPNKKDNNYLIPIKKAVRKAENLAEGDEVELRIELVEI